MGTGFEQLPGRQEHMIGAVVGETDPSLIAVLKQAGTLTQRGRIGPLFGLVENHGAAAFSFRVLDSATLSAGGTIVLTDQPADTNTVEINDGLNTVTFEFDTGGGVVTYPNVIVAVGADYLETLDNLAAAIVASDLAVTTDDPNDLVHHAPVKLTTAAALTAYTASGGPGVGRILTGDAVGVLTVDAVATGLNDRICVKDAVADVDNGLYKVTTEGTGAVAYVLTRATDADTDAEVVSGLCVFTTHGTANADKWFEITTADPIVVGTTGITIAEFTGAIQRDLTMSATASGALVLVKSCTNMTTTVAYLPHTIRVNGADVALIAIAPGGKIAFAIEGTIKDYIRFDSTSITAYGRLVLCNWGGDLTAMR